MALYQKEFEVAKKAIILAGKAILKIYNTDFNVSIKADNSEVTNADLASEKVIKATLMEAFPGYGILSEESIDNKERVNNDYCFIVDPLDGTKDFVNKTNNFAINIALSYKHEIVVGLIYVPCKDILYYAIKDQGAFKIENGIETRIHVRKKTTDLTMVISQFFFKSNDEFKENKNIKEMIPIGSSYKAGLIAEGKADFCIKYDPHTKEWDTAPSEIIIAEANGFMGNMYGEKMYYNKEQVYNLDGFIIANSKEVADMVKKARQ